MKRFLSAAALALLTTTALPAHAAEVTWWKNPKQSDDYGIKISGDILAGDEDRFRDTLKQLLYRNYGERMNIVNVAVTVHLDSNGGIIGDAMKIGTAIRNMKFKTFVADGVTCASSCGLIWLAGTTRYVGTKGHIGFHAIYDGKTKQATPDGNAVVGAYLGSLGFDYNTIAFLTRTPPDSMEWLNASVAKQYGIKALTCADGVCSYN